MVHLLAEVANWVILQEWQRPTMSGVTVGHRTTVVKTTLTENAWGQLSAMVYSVDCCAIGECGLDYTEPLPSLHAQRRLFQRQIVIPQELRKPLAIYVEEKATAEAGYPPSAENTSTLLHW